MKPFPLFFGLLLVVSTTAQEHAPTAAQCQADVAVWGDSEIINQYLNAELYSYQTKTANRAEISKLGWQEVDAREAEMAVCPKVDPQGAKRYVDTANFYEMVMGHRLGDFVMRHNLWQQFSKEDAEGER